MTNNVDPAEIEQFTRLANIWWDTKGSMGLLHSVNPLRVGFIEEAITLKNLNVLDIGCGGGILTEALAKAGANVTGIDLAKMPLEIAKQHAEKSKLNIDYRLQSAEDLAKEYPGHFDVVICLETLEHVPDPKKMITTCAALLKPKGHTFFSTINRTIKAYLFAILGAEYVLRIMPKGTHHYKKLIRPTELTDWAEINKLHLQKTSSFMYNPLQKSFKLRPGADVNYIMHFVQT